MHRIYQEIEITEKFLKDHGIENWGDFNHYPTPCVETDFNDFLGWFSSYGISQIEFRQVYLGDKNDWITSVHIIPYYAVIFMIAIDWNYNRETGKSEYTPRTWKIGCQHDFEEIRATRYGEHWRKCKKCGYEYYYDSSG
jgi:hypothetical protein